MVRTIHAGSFVGRRERPNVTKCDISVYCVRVCSLLQMHHQTTRISVTSSEFEQSCRQSSIWMFMILVLVLVASFEMFANSTENSVQAGPLTRRRWHWCGFFFSEFCTHGISAQAGWRSTYSASQPWLWLIQARLSTLDNTCDAGPNVNQGLGQSGDV